MSEIIIYKCKYSDGFGSGSIYYSLKPEYDILQTIRVDKKLLEDQKNNFDNVRDLLDYVIRQQVYKNELNKIGIKL